jgi:ATP-dependent Clp protease ATP-binding subunit ClpA
MRDRLAILDPTRAGDEALALEQTLRRLVIGQDEAVQQIVSVYQTHLTGMSPPGRPVGNLLFLGPTGTGKTRTVEAMAETLIGEPRSLVKIDCAEFQHSHEIAKLIGSPPGYLGHRETHALLSQDALNARQTPKTRLSFVLFDEIEKASDALWNLLLGILDKATLTTGDNKRVDFSRTLIFMTSNLGAAEISAMLTPRMGFGSLGIPGGATKAAGQAGTSTIEKRIGRSGIDAARRKFTPEFMNRLDKIVVFRPLSAEQMRQVLDLELEFVQKRVFDAAEQQTAFVFTVTPAAKDFMLAEGTDLKYGARHLKRAVERLLVQPVSNLMATGQVKRGDWVKVDVDEASGALTFQRESEGLPISAMAELARTSLGGLHKIVHSHERSAAARSGRR